MPEPGDPPFPAEAVRDLLGIVRAMYAGVGDADPVRRIALERVGRDLAKALELGTCTPGTVGARAAWHRAERAAAELGDLVSPTEGALAMVRASTERARAALASGVHRPPRGKAG